MEVFLVGLFYSLSLVIFDEGICYYKNSSSFMKKCSISNNNVKQVAVL